MSYPHRSPVDGGVTRSSLLQKLTDVSIISPETIVLSPGQGWPVADGNGHSNYVNVWLKREAGSCTAEQLLELFERAMATLWNRAYRTLGEVTLTAIVDRVLYTASEAYSPFESLTVQPAGIDFRKLRAQTTKFDEGELREGVRFVLTEFIVVIGNLTAEILAPALRAELSKVRLKRHTPGPRHRKGKS